MTPEQFRKLEELGKRTITRFTLIRPRTRSSITIQAELTVNELSTFVRKEFPDWELYSTD